MNSGIYKLTFSDGNTYIGKSVDIGRRWDEHCAAFSAGKAARAMQTAYSLCGLPSLEVLVRCHRDHIDLMETVFVWLESPSLNGCATWNVSAEDITLLSSIPVDLGSSTGDHIRELNRLRNIVACSSNAKLVAEAQDHAEYWAAKYKAEKNKSWWEKIVG